MNCPESNLWAACLLRMFQDIEKTTKLMHIQVKRYGCTSIKSYHRVRPYIEECKGEWFRFICSNVGIHSDHVRNQISSLLPASHLIVPDEEFERRSLEFETNKDRKKRP